MTPRQGVIAGPPAGRYPSNFSQGNRMATKARDEPQAEGEGQPNVGAAIRGRVLLALGRPADLFRVAVLPLWGEYYRVNVLTGPDAATATVTHSFFVASDDCGNVVRSTPAITRRY